MESSHLYALHGLTVASDRPYSELPPGYGSADVHIRTGPVPAQFDSPRAAGVLYQAYEENYLLRVDGVARYWARSGREIVVEPAPGAAAADIGTLLLGTVFSALLHQRGVLVLHAGGVVGPRGAVLFAGESGGGKSTLIGALASRGYGVLTDDASAVTLDANRRPMVQPGWPRLKLWRDAVRRLGHETESLSRVRSGTEKYALHVPAQFMSQQQPLAAIFVLELHGEDRIAVETIENSARFSAVCSHTRGFRVVEGLGMQREHFKIASAVAAAVPMVRVKRPRRGDSLDELVTCVEQALL